MPVVVIRVLKSSIFVLSSLRACRQEVHFKRTKHLNHGTDHGPATNSCPVASMSPKSQVPLPCFHPPIRGMTAAYMCYHSQMFLRRQFASHLSFSLAGISLSQAHREFHEGTALQSGGNSVFSSQGERGSKDTYNFFICRSEQIDVGISTASDLLYSNKKGRSPSYFGLRAILSPCLALCCLGLL
jgi:hypothetical protein